MTDAQLGGVGPVLPPHLDVDERLAVRAEQAERRARSLRVLEDPVDDEAEELLRRAVFDQFPRQEIERLELFEIAAGIGPSARLLDLVDRDRDGHARRRIGDGQHPVGVVLGGLEDDLRVAEPDAVAGAEGMIALHARSVQIGSVGAAAVFEDPRTVVSHDLGVLAREVTILDRYRAVGCPPDGNGSALQLLPEGREQRRVHRDLSARGDGFHSRYRL